jgi:tetratricopeptide (TPR) repeat protein
MERRLSESHVWRAQRRYFDEQGVVAWSSGVVPDYVTSNPFIADAYARVALAFARDARARGWLAPGERLTVVELGAGSGRFGFHLLRRAEALGGADELRYVLTDISGRTLERWRTHPSLRSLLDDGRLHVARYDAVTDAGIDGVGRGPLVVIANYVFDGIPQDAFQVDQGALDELLLEAGEGDDPQALIQPRLEFQPRAATVAGYYGDAELERLLAPYATLLPHGATFPFPAAALRCLRALAALPEDGRLLLLAADRGDHRVEGLGQVRDIELALHGSISMRVNLHAIAAWFAANGGRAVHADAPPEAIDVGCYLLARGPLPETDRALRDTLGTFGPDDFYVLKTIVEGRTDGLTIAQALAFLRLAGWDGRIFRLVHTQLLRRAPDAEPAKARELERALGRVWESFFPISEDGEDAHELALELAWTLHAAKRDAAALTFFERAGDGPIAALGRGLSLERLGRVDDALAHLERALTLDPTLPGAARARDALASAKRGPRAER